MKSDLPYISFIIGSYLPENKHYLDLCIESLQAVNYPGTRMEIIVIGRPFYLPEYEGVKTVSPPEKEFGGERGLNYAAERVSPESEFLFFCNDDLVFTRDSVLNLVMAARPGNVIVNPISPCQDQLDHALLYYIEEGGQTMQLRAGHYAYEDLIGHKASLMAASSVYPPGVYFTDHLCMFSSCVPRKVWDKVGSFDENINTGPSDVDFSWRCRDAGVRSAVALNALVWHFGSVSLTKTLFKNKELQDKNWEYFKSKWGKYPPYVNARSE